LDKKSLNKGKR